MAQSRETDVAWAAGFIDGEGSFSFYIPTTQRASRRKPITYIRVVQVIREPLDHLVDLFGGGVTYRDRKSFSLNGIFQWHLGTRSAVEAAIVELMPYLIVKRPAAAIILEAIRDRSKEPSAFLALPLLTRRRG